MKSSLWFKKMIRFGAVIALCLAFMPISSPAGAMLRAAGTPDKPPLPGKSPAPTLPSVAGDEKWSSQFELGADDWIFAAVFAPNGDLYVAGDFHTIAGISASYVAYWNASTNQWSALGAGVNNRVLALAFSGNTLYVGGSFDRAGGAAGSAVASYNVSTHTWSNMGGGMVHAVTSPDVNALAVDGSGNVYAGGQFDSAGGVTARNIAKWNGSSWSAVAGGIGTTTDTVEALAVSGSDVYAGGTFSYPGQNIAHFNGSTWESLGGGTTDDVIALAISGSNLYAGGSFATVNGGALTVNYVAVWNIVTSTWSALGSGLDGPDADAIAVDASGHVYVGGRFTHAGGNPASRVAMWNGSSWSQLVNPSTFYDGVDMNVYGLAIRGSDVIVTGGFTHAGGYSALYLARWNAADQQWYAPGNSVNGTVYALAESGSDVYVGGDFTSAGGQPARSLAIWNSTTNTWSAVSSDQLAGCNGFLCTGPTVYALAVIGTDVYVGGDFYQAGSLVLNNIARLNGSTWNAMGNGLTDCNGSLCTFFVYNLAVDGAIVDAVGEFVHAGSTTVNNVAAWYSGAWHAFTDTGNTNTGTNGAAYAIAPDGAGDYYIGGQFTIPQKNLVYFDGYDWFVGWIAPNATVRAILLPGNDVVIGGLFTNAAGSGANYIARSISGAAWTPLGSSLNAAVYALVQRGSTIFAGGNFTQSGALGVNHVAAWDTVANTWSNLGSGADGVVNVLAADPVFLYVGGAFANAGGKPSQSFGRWGAYRTIYLPLTVR